MGELGKQDGAARELGSLDLLAAGLSVVWLLVAGLYFWLLPDPTVGNPLPAGAVLLAILLPVAVIWAGATGIKALRLAQVQTQRLQSEIDALRGAIAAGRIERSGAPNAPPNTPVTHSEPIPPAPTARPAPEPFAKTEPRSATRADAVPDLQSSLALDSPADDVGAPLSHEDLIRALNFPDDPEDRDGIKSLRAALAHRVPAQLIQASQDVLTLLSQDGIYMDDLDPDRAQPEYWRRFANGERGRPVAPLGGVRDRSSLALTSGRMREDAIFRDAAHHFLRKFDLMLERFATEASDEDIAALAETRTARAFMLLGRVSGAFD